MERNNSFVEPFPPPSELPFIYRIITMKFKEYGISHYLYPAKRTKFFSFGLIAKKQPRKPHKIATQATLTVTKIYQP